MSRDQSGEASPDMGPAPLPEYVPALRMEIKSRTITEASAAAATLLGVDKSELVGRPFVELVTAPERGAVGRRLDDVMLLGRDAFGCVALCPRGPAAAWVEIDAHYVYKRGQRVEMVIRRVDRPVTSRIADPPPKDGLVTDQSAPSDVEEKRIAPTSDNEEKGLAQTSDAAKERLAPSLDAAEDALAPTSGAAEEGLAQRSDAAEDGLAKMSLHEGEPTPMRIGHPEPDHAAAQARAYGDLELGTANARAEAMGLGGAAMALGMSALESAGVAALAVAQDGTVTSATSATERRLGRPIARVRGTHLADLFDLPEAAERALGHARAEGLRQSVLANLSGSQEQVFLDWVPGPSEGSGLVLVGTGEAAPKEPAGSEADRTQAKLLSFVAHDVRGAVANVTMGIRVVISELAGHPALPSVERALKESERAQSIIDDLLLVIRPGGRKRVPLSLQAILKDVVESRLAAAEQAGVTLILDPGPEIEIPAELSTLTRALGNLIDNAIQILAAGGVVAVSSALDERTKPGVRITVQDTGPGIPEELQPNVFEPFVSGREGGTGLGLAIVRRVVLDHGGQVDFDSIAGTGTTFTIWLPAS